MADLKITVDVYCEWDITPPIYRVYVDDCLLTERTYIWKNFNAFIKENLIVNLEQGTHSLKIESVNWPEKSTSKFRLDNFCINEKSHQLVNNQFII